MRTLVFFLSLIFFYNISSAQLIEKGINSAKGQCKALNKKRHAKPSNRGKGSNVQVISYVAPVISPERIAKEKAERLKKQQEEELLAKSNTKVEFKTFEPEGSKPVDINDLPPPVSDKHAEVRRKVLDMIKNGQAEQPITESLFFINAQDEFAYVDFEPFLMAVEFAFQGKMVLVEGHTDSNGDDEYNLNLSMKRVRQIERLMKEIGVPMDNISVIGYGETMPSYDNSTSEGRQKNRRVDFKIY